MSPEGAGSPRTRDWRLLRILKPHVAPHARAFGGALLLMAAGSGIQLVGPYLVKLAIDGPMARGDLSGLLGYALAYLLAVLLEGAAEAAQTVLVRVRGQDVLRSLRGELFAKAQRLRFSHLDRTPTGSILSRITSDVAVLSDLFSSGMVGLAGDALLLLGIALAMIQLDLHLALFGLAAVPVLVAVSEIFRRKMRTAYRITREKTAHLTARLQEFLTGFEVVRLFDAETWADEEFGRVNAEHRDAFLRSVTLHALFFPVVELLSALTLALLLWKGGGAVVEGAVTFGTLVAFFEYLQKFFRPLRDLSEKYNVLQASMAALERIGEFLELPEAGREGGLHEVPTGSVRFREVAFGYSPDQPVLRGLDLAIEPGEVVALVGPTGAGKSTLVHLLLGHYQPGRGTVSVDGIPLGDWDVEALRRQIALVPQDVFLFSGSLLENIRLGRPWVSEARAREAAEAVGLDGSIRSLPQGYDTPVREGGALLSSGQRQLVCFARALAGDPRILVLDEATSEVDQATEAQIEEALQNLFRGRTSLVVAHRLATVRRSDRVVVLSGGKIVEEGSHRALLKQGGLYRTLYELQFRRPAA